jgi:DHA1 family bicyclomycin/chloramphenicol resistance-like MFS transporter
LMAGLSSLTLLLGLLIALTPLGTDSWQPILPALAADLGAPVAAAQLTVTTFFIGLAIGQFAWGPVSDRFGRKPVLAAGLGLACAAALACVPATSAAQVAAARFVLGLGMSSGPVIGRAVVRDLYSHEKAAGLLARMAIVFSVVPIAAPLLGGALLLLGGWQGVLWLYVAMCGALLVASTASLRETAPQQRASINPRHIARACAAIVTEPRFLGPFGAQLCSQIGIFAFVANSAFTLVNGLGVTAAAYSLMFAAVMLGQIAGAWFCSRWVARVGLARMLRAGTMIVAVAGSSVAALAWAGVAHWLAVVLPFMAYMCGSALIMPNATAAALSPFARSAGTASSVMGASQFAVGALVSTLLGLLFDGTARPMASAAALAGVGAFLIERKYIRGKR